MFWHLEALKICEASKATLWILYFFLEAFLRRFALSCVCYYVLAFICLFSLLRVFCWWSFAWFVLKLGLSSCFHWYNMVHSQLWHFRIVKETQNCEIQYVVVRLLLQIEIFARRYVLSVSLALLAKRVVLAKKSAICPPSSRYMAHHTCPGRTKMPNEMFV